MAQTLMSHKDVAAHLGIADCRAKALMSSGAIKCIDIASPTSTRPRWMTTMQYINEWLMSAAESPAERATAQRPRRKRAAAYDANLFDMTEDGKLLIKKRR